MITPKEMDFLRLLAQRPYLPLARVILCNRADGQTGNVTLAPVYLGAADDPPEAVRDAAEVLLALEAKRLITLDYDKPLQNGDYSIVEESRVYREFLQSHQQTAGEPALEFGSVALTALGRAALDSLED